jgi:RNA polymerase sigma-70 factor (ECF subfamily)
VHRLKPTEQRATLLPGWLGGGLGIAFPDFGLKRQMPRDPIPGKQPVNASSETTSGTDQRPDQAQLSPRTGVNSNVSSVAIDRGLLARVALPKELRAEPATDSDAEVMLRVKAGDDSAFGFLVQKYRRPMVNFMYRMAHNAAAAEDLAQEVFLRVYRSREGYEASAKFTTWLYRIATNLAVNHARDTRHERPENMASLDEPDPETGTTMDVADSTMSAEEAILRRERLAAIRQKVQALPERQRMAVIMHKYQQMDYKQIADVLKLSESATKSLLFRAYETLRGQLKELV